ncbi:MAG: RNA methyltransferase [Lachnospiraceae bacterium]|nr:RNA methyltransferase [Lachnospiraceae bacterium]
MKIIRIEDLKDKKFQIFAQTSEVQLLRYYEPEPGIFIVESPNVVLRALEAGYIPFRILVEDRLFDKQIPQVFEAIEKIHGKEAAEDIEVCIGDHEILKDLTGYALVKGLWAAFRRDRDVPLREFLKDKRRIAVLFDVVNPTNVGAIIRSAAAMGVDGVVLTRASVNPLYRRASRVSMGTVFQIPWTQADSEESEGVRLIEILKENGFYTAAMALTNESVGIDDERVKQKERLAIVLGTEGDGLPVEVIEDCDITIKIPMHHGVDSLNVAAASAVAFWELVRLRRN